MDFSAKKNPICPVKKLAAYGHEINTDHGPCTTVEFCPFYTSVTLNARSSSLIRPLN